VWRVRRGFLPGSASPACCLAPGGRARACASAGARSAEAGRCCARRRVHQAGAVHPGDRRAPAAMAGASPAAPPPAAGRGAPRRRREHDRAHGAPLTPAWRAELMVGGSLFDAFRMTRALTLRRAIEVGRARAPRPRSRLPASRVARRLCAANPAAASADAQWRGRAHRWRSMSRAAWRTCTPRRRAQSSTGALRPRPADARAGRCERGPVPAFGYVGRGVSRARERERGAACARALTAPP